MFRYSKFDLINNSTKKTKFIIKLVINIIIISFIIIIFLINIDTKDNVKIISSNSRRIINNLHNYTETISDFREETSDDMMHSPATVDDDHLVFYNEDKNHIEVMNMIPKHHLESLHNNPSKKTRFIKRADD